MSGSMKGLFMNKCLKVTFPATGSLEFLRTFVQKQARDLDLEGTAQVMTTENLVVILICGPKDNIDSFVDLLHKGTKAIHIANISVEPFVKVKDYRGVFRIIE